MVKCPVISQGTVSPTSNYWLYLKIVHLLSLHVHREGEYARLLKEDRHLFELLCSKFGNDADIHLCPQQCQAKGWI